MSTSTSLSDRQRRPIEGMVLLAFIVGLMWVVEAINSLDHNALDNAGEIVPRSVGHLWTIFTAPFLHANFYPHFIAFRGAARLAVVTLIVVVIGGLGTWLISPSSSRTLGASGIVFGYATYLFARGLLERSWADILIGVIVAVVWGGALVSSLVPHAGISWQGHASGAVGGVVAAWLLAGRRGQISSGAGPGHRAVRDSLDRALAP
jgi:membrane associated rhomboid family serine protease